MKKALGKGLSSLIPDSYISNSVLKDEAISPGAQVEGLELIPISEIASNPDQPREGFSPDGIEELAQSIREKGVLQPIIVKRQHAEPGSAQAGPQYELICGERRVKAARLCGLEQIPAIIKDVAETELLEWALVENIQREDLNALEEARAFERLVGERGLSHEDVAKRIGKHRTTITNGIRLLRLPEEVLGYVRGGRLSAGHARAILGLFTAEQQVQLARRVVNENLTVRQVEDLVARNTRKRRARLARRLTPEVADLETRLCRLFGTEVRIFSHKTSPKGRIVISYSSLDELDRILVQIGLPPAA